jgi:hypothetical protein
MRKLFALTGFVGALVGLLGCGGNPAACSGSTFGGNCYVIVSPGTLVVTDASLTGTGSLVHNTALTGNASYRLTFTLVDGGKLILDSHSNTSLGNGVQVEFKRVAAVLQVRLKGSGTDKDISSAFTTVDATGTLTYQVDVHNAENPVHFLIWDTNVTSFTESNTTVNDETATPAPGTGTYWGLELTNATVTAAVVSTPKFTE